MTQRRPRTQRWGERRFQALAEQRERLLTALSHELRNPLAAMLHASRVITSTTADSDRQGACAVVERQVSHLSRMLDDLLVASRLSEHRLHFEARPVDLREIVGESLHEVRALAETQGQELTCRLPELPLEVEGSALRLRQVLVHLLTNAIRHGGRGGRVRIGLDREAGDAVIGVRDWGEGLSPELLATVFDLFEQGEQGPERGRGGLGLGLTLARRLVHLHGGRLRARSRGLGRGAEFRVHLPLLAAESAGVELSASGARPRRVVLVEDEEDSRVMLGMLLEGNGHEVSMAADGPSALELIRRVRPDVAIVDIGLPGFSGLEVARRLRSEGRGHELRLVALTGYGRHEDVAAAVSAGFDVHLTKPVDLEEIERAVSAEEAGGR